MIAFTKGSTMWVLLLTVLVTIGMLALVYFQGGIPHVVHQ